MLVDPPALEDALVRTLIVVCSRFLQRPEGDLAEESHRAAALVLSYISASNFATFFARFRARLAAIAASGDENPEMWDIEILQYVNLNQRRLGDILQELSANSRTLKKGMLSSVAVLLRKVIWNWINSYPAEFFALSQSQRRYFFFVVRLSCAHPFSPIA